MLPGNLPRPLLSLIFEPVANIRYSDEDALGSLWSVITKVSDAMSDGQRLENMTWRLWHRAYARRAITARPPTPSGGNSDLPIRRAVLLSPSLSFSSSSGTTSNSSDWDRDTAVGDSEESIPNSYNNNNHNESLTLGSVISPCLESVRLASGNSPIAQAAIASPALSISSGTSPPYASKEVNTYAPESPMPPSLNTSPRVVQNADAEVRSEITQSLDDISPISHHHHQSISLSQSPTDEYTSSHDPSTLHISQGGYVEDSISISSSPIPSHQQAFPGPADPSISALASPAKNILNTHLSTAPPEYLTVGKLISQILAETIVLTKPMRQSTSDGAIISQLSDSVPKKREYVSPSPRIQIIVPPESPSLNPNSTLTSATSTPRQTFPTVVVVNPTPHPTPPATPSIEATEKTFVLSSGAMTVIPPRPTLDVNISGTLNSQSGSNAQLATPVSLGKHSDSLNKHVTLEQQQIAGQRLSGSVVPESVVVFTASANTGLSSRLSGTSNSIALPNRPMNSSDIASHLPTPAAELTPDMSNGSSRAMSVPIQAAPAVPSEDKKFFLAMPHSGSHGSGHDSTESPDSFGTDSINIRRRDTARGSPLLNLRDSFSRPQIAPRLEEETSSSFSASSPAGRPPSITSSRAGGGASKLKGRATFTVSSGGGRRKGSSKKSVKDVYYKKETEKRLPSTDSQPMDESVEWKESRSLKGKEVDATERSEVVVPPALTGTNNAIAHVPRVKTLHNIPLSRLNNNTDLQTNLRQLPTNPPRRPASPFRQNDARPSALNGGSLGEMSQANQQQRAQYNSQLVGHLGLGHLPTIPPRPRRQIEITETSSDYSTTDTGEGDSWESDSGSIEEKKENISNGHSSKGRRSNLSKSEKIRNGNGNNRQRDPGESVRDAALEAQRQRDMFQKLPPRTYSNLGHLQRTKSGLSMLFRPDPELVPAGHPYRTSRSSQDLLARNWSIPALPLAMTAIQQRAPPIAPIEANVTVSSVKSKEIVNGSVGTGPARRSSSTQVQHNGGGGYRPRAKPVDQEAESDSDDPDDRIPLPNSVAERRLAALVRQKSRSQVHSPPSTSQKQPSKTRPKDEIQVDNFQTVTRTATMPVLPHQFLEPAPLQTPHEIRRRIISEELDEELRRNLLWERSQNQIPGRPPRQNGSILPGPWRTLTAIKAPTPAPEAPQSTRPPSEPHVESQIEKNGNPMKSHLFSTQRTKSWAGEYHATGW